MLRAQSTNASLTGRVTDPSKAAIAEARISAINTGTNFQYDAASNSFGEYFLANLPPGTYRMEVEKSGFKKLVRPDVALHVQDALAIDFEMAVGSVSDSITVQAGAPLVNTSDATVSALVDHAFVENIPLNGRDTVQLALTQPGVLPPAVNGAQKALDEDSAKLLECLADYIDGKTGQQKLDLHQLFERLQHTVQTLRLEQPYTSRGPQIDTLLRLSASLTALTTSLTEQI